MKRNHEQHPDLFSYSTPVDHLALPNHFTFPYYYDPHPLAQIAINELQNYLETQTEWAHDFHSKGNMFAVLVVRSARGELGFLASYRGKPNQDNIAPSFFARSHPISSEHQQTIDSLQLKASTLSSDINAAVNDIAFCQLKSRKKELTLFSERESTSFQQTMENNKKERNRKRDTAKAKFHQDKDKKQLDDVIKQLGIQSSSDKRAFKTLKTQWKQELDTIDDKIDSHEACILSLKSERQKVIESLDTEQQNACQLTNALGDTKSLYQLFNCNETQRNPIHHSIEENLPKLLQAAFAQGLTPLALGEFWWGKSPYNQIRQHKNLYPVCQSKCFEILEFMLKGIEIDESPLEQTPSLNKTLEIVYEDEALVVVNKPAEFLSVSGKHISDSVLARLQERYPDATGPLLVHRLDMSTSGLLVFTLTAETNKHVQKQFIERCVQKRYTALLEGVVAPTEGVIDLPLTGDMQDRPRQMVCHEHGRKAETRFEVLSVENGRTKVYLYPTTGRTHQLRVHCAHQAGLNTPIVGDDLYGFKDSRLHLHAGYLKLRHPVTEQDMEFEVPEEF
ncbi:RluA family pseudouridine synthase [Vibrio sp. 10N.261.55.A7]|uniref:RluA family pseudouridine synthase n=1 Tax=Vibrio sp. 10N.261.55.A7 TaxID=1880851 RepID=UPI000C84BEDB|nr:RluA family pseudouridine synthase [Vibrio sp. 10N.261.55.A7]PMJ98916.1 RNA pseudouridine synthase [Vibrio sp. 10N.261.55.A7]